MPSNTVRLSHGTTARIGGGAATAIRLTGSNPGTAVANPISLTLGGQSANISTSEPLDQSVVTKLKGIRNPGTATLTFQKEDNDNGQIAVRTAYTSANQFPFAICDGTSGDILLAFEGLVSGINTYSAGGAGEYLMLEVTVELTAEPA